MIFYEHKYNNYWHIHKLAMPKIFNFMVTLTFENKHISYNVWYHLLSKIIVRFIKLK